MNKVLVPMKPRENVTLEEKLYAQVHDDWQQACKAARIAIIHRNQLQRFVEAMYMFDHNGYRIEEVIE